jgi:glycosyltransferase involved in cell wall biosynthesis
MKGVMMQSAIGNVTSRVPLVSVVMATYHGDDIVHLKQSVDSILGQSIADFEFIVVIDGPISCNTQKYLQSIHDPRVNVIPIADNGGPARARNIAIRIAKGQYIAIQDADDISDSERLHKQLTYLTHNNLDLISSCVNQIDDEGKIILKKRYPERSETIKALMPFINSINNSAVFCRADLLKKFSYDESLRFGEDYNNWITWLKHGYVMGNHPEYLVSYRLASSRRRGWKIAKVDLRIKLAALSITPWYQVPVVVLVAFLTVVIRMTPSWAITYIYRIKELLFPRLVKY